MSLPGNGAPKPCRKTHRPQIELLWDAYWAHPCDEHRNLLVEGYQDFVREIVRRFSARLPRVVDRGDLATAANVGLMCAIAAFDAGRGVPFEAYCEWRIRGSLVDELRSQDWLPRPWRARIEAHKRAIETLRGGLGRNPGDAEVAEFLGLGLAEYETLFGCAVPGEHITGQTRRDGREEPANGLDILADNRGSGPEDRLTRDELLRLVGEKLSDLEYRVVYLKYWEELPMREIGQLIHLSESRVCKIHARLIDRLRDRFRVGAS